jgi:hypothetical protein
VTLFPKVKCKVHLLWESAMERSVLCFKVRKPQELIKRVKLQVARKQKEKLLGGSPELELSLKDRILSVTMIRKRTM